MYGAEGKAGAGLRAPARRLAPARRQVVSPEDMVGYAEHAKGSKTTKIFEDAYKSPLSIVILVRGRGPRRRRGAARPRAQLAASGQGGALQAGDPRQPLLKGSSLPSAGSTRPPWPSSRRAWPGATSTPHLHP